MKRLLFLAAALLPSLSALAQEPSALTKLQDEFLSWKFGMFIHFNLATFNNRQWATGHEDPATFAPTRLDCGQWADAAKAAGMKYAVFTVKHTGGWCLWDSYEYPYLKATKRPNPLPPEDNVHVAEVCDTLGLGWFWTPRENEGAMKSVEEVTAMLDLCKQRRANYLLNVGPDGTGRLPDYAVKRLREIEARLTAPQPGPDKP